MTLIELLIFLGLLAILAAVLFGGGSPGPSSVPGADQFVANVTNAENVIGQFSGRTPTKEVCEIIKNYYALAEQGLGNMQVSGKVDSNALRAARERLDKIKAYLEANCA